MAGKPKIRAQAQAMARALTNAGISMDQIQPGPDGWHTEESIKAALRPAWERNQQRPWGSTDPVDWAVSSGRLLASSAPEWRSRLAADRAETEQTLRILAPVLASTPSRLPATAASPPRPGVYRNAVEELAANHGAMVAAASAAEPPPEMFPGSGDFPIETASGISPAALAGLPWRARLAAAHEPNRSKAFELTQDYGDSEGDWSAYRELGNHPAVRFYVTQVETWFSTAGVNEAPSNEPLTPEEEAALFGQAGRVSQPPQQSGK